MFWEECDNSIQAAESRKRVMTALPQGLLGGPETQSSESKLPAPCVAYNECSTNVTCWHCQT